MLINEVVEQEKDGAKDSNKCSKNKAIQNSTMKIRLVF